MIIIDKKEVHPVECSRCKSVSGYVVDEEMAAATAYCVRCVTREQDVIKRNESLSEFLAKSGK